MGDFETVLGVDIGTSTVKVASLIRGANGYAAELLAIEPVMRSEGDDALPSLADYQDALGSLVKQHGLRGSRCALSLSGDAVAPRYFSFPRMDSPEQVAQAVQFEAPEIIPFELSETLMDHQVFPFDPDSEGKTEGVLIAARSEAVNQRFDMARAVGLNPVVFDVDGLALTNCFIESGGGAPPPRPTLVLNIGHQTTNLAVITTSGRTFIRDIPVGGDQITSAIASHYGIGMAAAEALKAGPVLGEPNPPENAAKLQNDLRAILSDGLSNLLNEIRDSVGFFTGQRFFETIDEVWVTGGAASFPGLPEFIGETYGIPSTGWNPLADISLTKVEEGRNPARADALGPRFAEALGLAMRPDPS